MSPSLLLLCWGARIDVDAGAGDAGAVLGMNGERGGNDLGRSAALGTTGGC